MQHLLRNPTETSLQNISAHVGFEKTLDRIKRIYFCPKMSIDFRIYVAKCSVSKETKAPMISLNPNGRFSVRTVSKIQVWQYLLIVLDHLSKFALLKPLRNATTAEIVKFIVKDVFHLFGVPVTVPETVCFEIDDRLCKTYGAALSNCLLQYIHRSRMPQNA